MNTYYIGRNAYFIIFDYINYFPTILSIRFLNKELNQIVKDYCIYKKNQLSTNYQKLCRNNIKKIILSHELKYLEKKFGIAIPFLLSWENLEMDEYVDINHALYFPKLKSLNINTSKIPHTIHTLTKLQNLTIQTLDLELIPNEIFMLTTLKCLNLKNSKICNISTNISNLQNLEELNLSYNKLNYFPELCNFRQLKKLTLNNNNIKDIPDLSNLIKLEELFLHNNMITHIPKKFYKLKELRYFSADIFAIVNIKIKICEISTLSVIHVKGKIQYEVYDKIIKMLKTQYTIHYD